MKYRMANPLNPVWRKYRRSRDHLRRFKRQILRSVKKPKLALEYSTYRKMIGKRDWISARDRARLVAQLALATGDRRLILEMMQALERFDCFEESARLRMAWRQLLPNRPANQWHGESLSGKALLIDFTDKVEQGLGLACRGISLVAKAAKQARRVYVVVEPRMVPIYQRSFPQLDILETRDGVAEDQIDFVAMMGNLVACFAPDENTPDPDFHPLHADLAKAADLRSQYQDGKSTPLVGIFWFSSHHGKELPDLAEWRTFINSVDAQFVSLQYGDVTEDIEALGRDRVLVDPMVDQFVDMDAFAAQVAALDAVITISGTTAHVAGALGTPTVVLRDDWFRRQWPVLSDRVPWYPNLRVAGKDGREWGPAFDDAWTKVRSLMADRPQPL
jgi:hypothetical protein